MTFNPSPYQQAIFDWIKDGSGNAVVNAVAGSGKTTTIVQAAKLLPASISGVFVAFNNHIVGELKGRLADTPMTASTVHSIGRSSLTKVISKIGEPDGIKYRKIAKAIVEKEFPYREFSDKRLFSDALNDLANYARQTLTPEHDRNALYRLALRFDVELPEDEEELQQLLALFPEVLKQGEELARGGVIDFTDMLYLPYRWKITPNQSQWVFADEIQDFNAAQLDLVIKLIGPGGRLLGVGDPKQSIMGFAGADSDSFWKIKDRAKASELPLSVCYRCPTSHISLAQQLVPHLEAAPGKEAGVVTYSAEGDLFKLVQTGDLIICRKTAPIVSACIALIAKGVAAKVRGRNVSKTLTDLAKQVQKMHGFIRFDEFVKFLDQFKDQQIRVLVQKDGTEEQIENLRDRVEALEACYKRYVGETPASQQNIDGLCKSIESLFSDDNPGVWLSTIHRAKGLEADRVLFLERDKLPLRWDNQRPDQYEQEKNLLYVGLTRAKKELIIFGKPPAAKQEALPLPEVKEPIDPFTPPAPAHILQAIAAVEATPLAYLLHPGMQPPKPAEPEPTHKPHRVPDWDRRCLTFEYNVLLAKYGTLTEGQRDRLAIVRETLGLCKFQQTEPLQLAVAA